MTYWKNVILFGIKSVLIYKHSDSEPAYNNEYLKSKRNSHANEVTDFYDKKITKVDSDHTCLAVIGLDSSLEKECKYTEKKVIRHINDNLSDFSSSDESDEECVFDKYLSFLLLDYY